MNEFYETKYYDEVCEKSKDVILPYTGEPIPNDIPTLKDMLKKEHRQNEFLRRSICELKKDRPMKCHTPYNDKCSDCWEYKWGCMWTNYLETRKEFSWHRHELTRCNTEIERLQKENEALKNDNERLEKKGQKLLAILIEE